MPPPFKLNNNKNSNKKQLNLNKIYLQATERQDSDTC